MLLCPMGMAEQPEARLLYQGHGSLRIVAAKGKVIYIDPYAGKGYDLPADLILVSHGHVGYQINEGFDLKQATTFWGNHFLLSERQRLAIVSHTWKLCSGRNMRSFQLSC